MKSLFAVFGTVALLCMAVGFGAARQLGTVGESPVEIAVLSESNWDQFVPEGKEVDAIYGDVVMRNGHLTAVIAQPLATRHANMTVRDVAGAVIDLTSHRKQADQLAAFYPGRKSYAYRLIAARGADGSELPLDKPISSPTPAGVAVTAEGNDEHPEAVVFYELSPTERFMTVTTTFTNRSNESQSVSLEDDLRVDGGKEDMVRSPNGMVDRFWLDDRFWGQAYGLDCAGSTLQLTSDTRVTSIKYESKEGSSRITLEPGKSFQFKRRLYAGANLVEVNAIAANLKPSDSTIALINVRNKKNHSIPRSLIEFKRNGTSYGTARTDAEGQTTVTLPQGDWTADVFALGRQIASNVPVRVNTAPMKFR